MRLQNLIRKSIYSWKIITRIFGRGEIEKFCSCCESQERFETIGHPPRYGSLCPKCGSLERHRLLALIDRTEHFFEGKTILHFAPEPCLSKLIKKKAEKYVTADIHSRDADLKLNIENIDQPDETWDIIVCSHVLEHVNDKAALKEMYRILRNRGQLICMVPIVEGLDNTYENIEITSEFDRLQHFGQQDHIRIYGKDFRNRLRKAGFHLQEYSAEFPDILRCGLQKGDRVFVGRK